MAAKSERRWKALVAKKLAKETAMKKPGFKSKYALKSAFLAKHGGFGFDYPDKPWKGAA